jgi:hypothetical protein
MRPGSVQATTAVSAVTFANDYAAPECRMFEPSYETTVGLTLQCLGAFPDRLFDHSYFMGMTPEIFQLSPIMALYWQK